MAAVAAPSLSGQLQWILRDGRGWTLEVNWGAQLTATCAVEPELGFVLANGITGSACGEARGLDVLECWDERLVVSNM